jgi:hypothetical protein
VIVQVNIPKTTDKVVVDNLFHKEFSRTESILVIGKRFEFYISPELFEQGWMGKAIKRLRWNCDDYQLVVEIDDDANLDAFRSFVADFTHSEPLVEKVS